MYTISQVSKMLNLHYNTIYKWCKSGQIQSTKYGRVYRISEEELEHIKAVGVMNVK
jgi:excisionase family DNA binding protein